MNNNNKKLARNSLFLYLRMFFVLIITLYTSRVILSILGVEDYGIYTVVAGFVSFFGFLTSTLSSSMQRFYNYEGTQRGFQGVQDVYNSGFFIHLLLVFFCLIVMETGGVWYVNNVMNVPVEKLSSVRFLLQTCTFSLLILILQIPYIGIILAKERMDFYALVCIMDVILQLLIVIILPYLTFDKLSIYGIMLASVSFVRFAAFFIYAYFSFDEIRLQRGKNKKLLYSILAFSGWNLLGTFVYMLRDQGVNMLLNVFFGPLINAARGISFQIKGALVSFSSNITTAFRPQVVNSYAAEDFIRTKNLFFIESKLTFALIILLAFPLMFNIDSILSFWLGENVPKYTNVFSILVLIDLFIGIFNQPSNQVVWATGKLRNYQIANSIVNFFLLPVCFVVLKLGYSAISSFILTIIFSIINQVVCIIFMNKLFRVGLKNYLFQVILPSLESALLLFILLFTIDSFLPNSFGFIVILCLVELLLSIPIFYLLLLNKSEKIFVVVIFKKYVLKK